MKSIIIKLLIAFVGVGLGLGAGLTYGHFTLKDAQELHAKELKKLERKVQSWERKYSEKNVQLESQRRTAKRMQAEAAELKNQLAETRQSESVRIKKAAEKIATLHQQVAGDELRILELRAAEERLTVDLDRNRKRVAELEKVATELQKRSARLDTNLRQKSRSLQRCEKHNVELANVSGELLESYRNKGVLGAFKQSEPFTGIGRVKLENLLQEYGFKIEDHTMEQSTIN